MLLRSASLILLTLAVLLPLGCGGGGGGGGGGGKAPGQKGFVVVAGPTGALIAGLNSGVPLVFNKDVDEDSVSPATINIVTVEDVTGQSTQPPGIFASVQFVVEDERVTIQPTVEFSPDQVSFGFAENALYEVSFSTPETGASVLSAAGVELKSSTSSFFFRTPDKAADNLIGFPEARLFFVDDTDAIVFPEMIEDGVDANLDPIDEALAFFTGVDELVDGPGTIGIEGAPLRELLVVFDEAVIPSTVFNSIDSSSPSIRVLVNTVALPSFEPIIAPAEIAFLHQQDDLTLVRWRSDLQALPPSGFVRIEVAAGVQDLAGNSKFSVTLNLAPLSQIDLVVDGTLDTAEYPLFEPFDTNAKQDTTASASAWAVAGSGVLAPILAGGRGLDGPLVLDDEATPTDLGDSVVPIGARVDLVERVLRLPTVRAGDTGQRVARPYEFTKLDIPPSWTVEPLVDGDGDGEPDPEFYQLMEGGIPVDDRPAPLSIFVSGVADIGGVLRVTPVPGESIDLPNSQGDVGFAAYLGAGASAGGPVAGAAGGNGGKVLLVDAGAVALPLASPETDAGLAYEASDGKLRGVTGRSEQLNPTQLVDDDVDLSMLTDPLLGLGGSEELFAMLERGEILLQPNVGIGSSAESNASTPNQLIDENHPSFVVESVSVTAGSSTITVADGSMVQASQNFSDGGPNAFHPIAAAGDPYLIGPFAGLAGDDASGLDRGGRGGLPYVVVNTGVFTLTTSGGGGGAGGVMAGQPGGDSGPLPNPAVNDSATSGGIALADAAGAEPGLGLPRGTGTVLSATEYMIDTTLPGSVPVDAIDPALLVGARLLPNAPDDGWIFEISAFDGSIISIAPLELVDDEIDLMSGAGDFAGPGLGAQPTSFLVLPAEGELGAGGGGTGVTVTGTINVTESTLPRVSPGAGGGSGGGTLRVEVGQQMILRNSAKLSVDGGEGGSIDDDQLQMLAGGGGGSGGEMLLSASGFQIFQSAAYSAVGGAGGGAGNEAEGGAGGNGYLRFESHTSELQLAAIGGMATPALGEENVGRRIGPPQSVGQSGFYNLAVINPEIESLSIVYSADTDGIDGPETGLVWNYDAAGASGDFLNPPFRFRFNPTGVSLGGLTDVEGASPTFYEPYDLVSGRSGLVYDSTAGDLLYIIGNAPGQVWCLNGVCGDQLLGDLPGVSGALQLVSLALGGVDEELFLLERGTGRVHVLSRDGFFRRTIRLPFILEGAMAFRSTLDGDRLLIASNRTDELFAFPTIDVDAAEPATTGFAPAVAADSFPVRRDGVKIDLELTGMALDGATDRLWLLNGAEGRLLEVRLDAGMEGVSNTGAQVDTRLTLGGSSAILSALAFDGTMFHITRSLEPASSTLISVDPLDLNTLGASLALPDAGVALPATSRSIADGNTFLRFQIAIDGLFDNADEGVSFRQVSIEEVELISRNASFLSEG